MVLCGEEGRGVTSFRQCVNKVLVHFVLAKGRSNHARHGEGHGVDLLGLQMQAVCPKLPGVSLRRALVARAVRSVLHTSMPCFQFLFCCVRVAL